ncbi:MAG: aminopeptidase P family protein, partial [Alphaproteobacteria bacterium]|nr:aminopeptidase P family protein [Alphaproteobacteria bacterium]
MHLTPPFSDRSDLTHLEDLRNFLKGNQYEGIIVPRVNCFQGEYVAPFEERLAWLTGFTGSAGFAIVLVEKACLFVDGRYTLQAQRQVNLSMFETKGFSQAEIRKWLVEHLPSNGIILYDPWLHTVQQFKEWKLLVAEAGGVLQASEENPIDKIWKDKPTSPLKPIVPHPLQWSGQESIEKRQRICRILEQAKVSSLILTSPDSIAWLLNIRGGDVRYTPICHAFVILRTDASVDVYVHLGKVTDEIREYCGPTVRWNAGETFIEDLTYLEGNILLDPKQSPQKIVETLQEAGVKIIYGDDPCVIMRAVKNTVELRGAHAAHQRDGAAMINFLAWLDKNVFSMEITEIDAAKYLESERRKQFNFQDLSFSSISSAGPNAAIVHYHPTPETNTILKENSLYLIDSGGQYLEGTTDITRTVAIGEPSEEQKDRYTRVLKGHIALASAIFPVGTTGTQLDVLARLYLWKVGLDFDHGTGHGVGSYLNVHEGPHRISKIANSVALQPGMIVSNEPGYYKTGEYGIRLENLITVIKSPVSGEREMLT